MFISKTCKNKHCGICLSASPFLYIEGHRALIWMSILNLFVAWWRHMASYKWVNIGSGNCLMTPNHYLYRCWLIITKVPWHSHPTTPISKPRLKISFINSHPDSPRVQWVNELGWTSKPPKGLYVPRAIFVWSFPNLTCVLAAVRQKCLQNLGTMQSF